MPRRPGRCGQWVPCCGDAMIASLGAVKNETARLAGFLVAGIGLETSDLQVMRVTSRRPNALI
jgi:hypothetical protein